MINMNSKIIILTLALLLAITFACALTPQDLTWNGYVNVYLDKPVFSVDENITGQIVINNNEDYPMVGNKLVFQIAQGKYSYPSEYSIDNVLLEDFISDIWALPRSMKTINFSLTKQLPGEYRLDVYSWILKSKFIGSSSIFLSPNSTTFTVAGNPVTNKVIIDRKNTVFGADGQKIAGPNSFPINAGAKINGIVSIKNNSQETVQGLKLSLSLCDWAIVFCQNPKEIIFDVPTLQGNETKEVTVEFTAPNTPSAYEINIKLLSATQLVSLYKSRVIVSGGTAKIRKVFIDGLKDRNYSVTTIISGSPDHFSNPSFENFQLNTQLFNKDQIVSQNSIPVSNINTGDINQFNFQANTTSFDKACIRIVKDNTTFEEECFSVPLEDLQNSYDALNPKAVDVSWNYNELTGILTLTLKKDSINARYRIIDLDKTLVLENVIQKGNYSKDISVQKNDLTLIIDDFDAKNQQVFTINLKSTTEKIKAAQSPVDSNKTEQFTQCNGTICNSSETCLGASYPLQNGTCCTTTCTPSIIPQNNDSLPPLIFTLAIILIIIAIFVVSSAVKELKK